jgi:hypothetical protein
VVLLYLFRGDFCKATIESQNQEVALCINTQAILLSSVAIAFVGDFG